jgi:hypothetical protein
MNIVKMALELAAGIFMAMIVVTVVGAVALLIFAVLFIAFMGCIAAIFV